MQENKILLEKLLTIQSRPTLEPAYSTPTSRNTLFKQTQEQLKMLTEVRHGSVTHHTNS